jgi:putative sigma-54 modulation protein
LRTRCRGAFRRHGHLNDSAQQFIREKAEKLMHYFDRLTMIEVTVDLRGDEKHAP